MKEVAITAAEINAEYELARTSFVDSANRILNVGRMLERVKEDLPHGAFMTWVDANCVFTHDAANRMMRAFRKSESTLNLTEADALFLTRLAWGNNGSVVEKYTGEDEWYTPSEYVESVRSVLGGIDLDPASSEQANKIVRADRYFTKADDGLAQEWSGNVFLNPPYKQPLVAQFSAKLVECHEAGDVNAAVLLTNNSTDTKWWQHAALMATAACFTAGRIKFYRDREYDAPTNGQVFLFFGHGSDAFVNAFKRYGWIARPSNG